jgi:katanin p60 ATPase-containing subunit A1
MNHKIAGKIRDEIKNIHKDEISKDLVAMCDFEETQRSEKWFAELGPLRNRMVVFRMRR